jgi:hypothetical protein
VLATLQPPWNEAPLRPGDTVNLMFDHCGGKDEAGRRVVELSHGHGLLVLHPDLLLSGRAGRCCRAAAQGPALTSGRPCAEMPPLPLLLLLCCRCC